MKQENVIRLVSDDKKMSLLCDVDTSYGALHDFLLLVKGTVVEKISNAQKEEQKASDALKAKEAEKESPEKEEKPVKE